MDLFDAVRANGSHTLMADRMREALERYSPEGAPRVCDAPWEDCTPLGEGTPGTDAPPYGDPQGAPMGRKR